MVSPLVSGRPLSGPVPPAASVPTMSVASATGVSPLGVQVGSVVDFDEHRGIGTVAAGGHQWLFHCTTIVDGTRTIEPGTAVAFDVRAGGPGRWEAFDLTTLGS